MIAAFMYACIDVGKKFLAVYYDLVLHQVTEAVDAGSCITERANWA
jgi:hypothetical protein